MKDNELLFDRKNHVLYSKPCKKEIRAKIALHYPATEREATWEKVQRQYVVFLSDWRTDLGGKKNFHNGVRFNTSYSIVRLLTPNSLARFSLVSCRRRHKTSSMACRLSAAVISAVHLLFSNFLPAFYKSNSQVLCDFEKII